MKCRVVTDPSKRSERQLSPFRSWDCDAVVIVLFDEHFALRQAARLPTEIVRAAARWQEHVRGDIVFATDALLSHPAAEDWLDRLQRASQQPPGSISLTSPT